MKKTNYVTINKERIDIDTIICVLTVEEGYYIVKLDSYRKLRVNNKYYPRDRILNKWC